MAYLFIPIWGPLLTGALVVALLLTIGVISGGYSNSLAWAASGVGIVVTAIVYLVRVPRWEAFSELERKLRTGELWIVKSDGPETGADGPPPDA